MYLSTRKKEENMKKDLMRNFSFSIYKATYNRYIAFKNKKKLTHDETINILLDVYEGVEEKGNKNENG